MGLGRQFALINASKPTNLLKGLTPEISGFDEATPLINPLNMVDGNLNTYSGPGIKIATGASSVFMSYDLGAVKTVRIGGRIGMWSSAGVIYPKVNTKDNTETINVTPIYYGGVAQTMELPVDLISTTLTGRYIIFSFVIDAAGTMNIKPYNLWAIEETGV